MTEQKKKFDVVLSGGRVIDPETYLDGTFNVGINGGQIAAVSDQPLSGKQELDVSGMIVSPGFIDLHSHAVNIASNRIQAFDGVTSALELEGGILPIGEFYDNCAKEGRPINYGASAGWASGRLCDDESGPGREWQARAQCRSVCLQQILHQGIYPECRHRGSGGQDHRMDRAGAQGRGDRHRCAACLPAGRGFQRTHARVGTGCEVQRAHLHPYPECLHAGSQEWRCQYAATSWPRRSDRGPHPRMPYEQCWTSGYR